MSTKSKIERELYGPSLIEVTLGAAISIVLGGLLAAGYLLFKPVQTVRVLPPEEEQIRGQVYHVEGSRDAARGRQWMRKRQLLTEGQPAEITLVEEELSAWVSEGARPATEEGQGPGLVAADRIAFRIREGIMQIGITGSLNAFGYSQPMVFQAKGDFEWRNDRFVFVPEEFHVGSLPIHNLPLVGGFLTARIMATQAMPEDVVAAWDRLAAVEIEDNVLKLTVQ